MKKMKYILLITMLSAGFCFTAKAQEKGIYASQKAVKVKKHYKIGKDRASHLVISGYNKKNKKIWSHKAKAKEEYQVYLATYKKRKNKVYLFDGKNLKIYRLSNGKKLKQFKIPIAAGHNIAFDSKDNLYLSGYFNDDVYKIDAKGKIIWKSSAKEFGLADAYGLKYKKGVVTQYYEVSPTSDVLDIDKNYYACFNAADGTIVDYRQ